MAFIGMGVLLIRALSDRKDEYVPSAMKISQWIESSKLAEPEQASLMKAAIEQSEAHYKAAAAKDKVIRRYELFIAAFIMVNVFLVIGLRSKPADGEQVAAADGQKPGKFTSNHDAMTPRQG